MYRDAKAAHVAAYFLFKAGAEGMSRRYLLALMYLYERHVLKCRGYPTIGDSYMLTADGPVLRETHARVMGGLHRYPGANQEWDRLAAVREPSVVSEAGVVYGNGAVAAGSVEDRLVLRSPQAPPRWSEDGELMEHEPVRWTGREEGMPYLGQLSLQNREDLGEIWSRQGGRDEADLVRHMRELPECGGEEAGEFTASTPPAPPRAAPLLLRAQDLPLEVIFRNLGYTEREVLSHLEFARSHGYM